MKFSVLLTGCLLSARLVSSQPSLVTENDLNELAASEFLSFSAMKDTSLSEAAARLQKINGRLVAAVRVYARERRLPQLKTFTWELVLVDKKDINAFCLPGGRMVIGVPMFRWAQSEAALAAVMAHQLAHVLLGHGEQRLRQALKDMLGGRRFAELRTSKPADARDLLLAAYGGGNVALLSAFETEQEKEADKFGMVLMAIAGFDPGEAIVFWQRMAYLSTGPERPVLLSAHRYAVARKEQMELEIDPITRKYYRQTP
ncbi:M48 family metallopeptidase [Sediminibacterium soli]|uniref:M48 family metallopeptidase n=1 Tax=Sediminibacterium soli TaxID=2698829 RepID=UPI001379AF8E|nr:M48 family metallopeptidase [Sediminibacterium soli]NCI46068.1 M48 family metallopeptidase [Sediminibacterium soli]